MAELAEYRQAHPIPFVITHWVNLCCIFSLIFTGFCIHYPFFPGFMGIAKGFHIGAGFVLAINCLARIIMAFIFTSAPTKGTRVLVKDFKTWLPQIDSRHQMIQWVKYYLFLRKTKPLSGKLNNLQKLAYLCIPILIFFQFYTGLCMWEYTMFLPPFMGFTRLVGGIMNMHIIHYFVMFLFILFIMLHVYLALIEGLGDAGVMLFRNERGGLLYNTKRHIIQGSDDHHYMHGEYEPEREGPETTV